MNTLKIRKTPVAQETCEITIDLPPPRYYHRGVGIDLDFKAVNYEQLLLTQRKEAK